MHECDQYNQYELYMKHFLRIKSINSIIDYKHLEQQQKELKLFKENILDCKKKKRSI